jgi:hypothetical protein
MDRCKAGIMSPQLKQLDESPQWLSIKSHSVNQQTKSNLRQNRLKCQNLRVNLPLLSFVRYLAKLGI